MGIFLVVTVLGVAGCGAKQPTAAPPTTTKPSASGGASPSGSASATPSGTPTTLIEFTVDGAGPYQLGATLSALQTAKSIEGVAAGTTCPDTTTAHGTGTWRDIQLSFRKDGTLYLAVNRSASIPTPSGAWLGSTVAQLKAIYVGVTGEELTKAPTSAFLVTTLTGRGILFDLDANKKVTAMTAGDAAFLKSSYVGGTNFC
jgi:hypothetical protein